jgi:hypothetical protein
MSGRTLRPTISSTTLDYFSEQSGGGGCGSYLDTFDNAGLSPAGYGCVESADTCGYGGDADLKTALNQAATATAGLALLADASVVGAPVGAVLGEVSAGLSTAAAIDQCGFQAVNMDCAVEVANAALGIVTVGLSRVVDIQAEAKLLGPVAADLARLSGDALTYIAGELSGYASHRSSTASCVSHS